MIDPLINSPEMSEKGKEIGLRKEEKHSGTLVLLLHRCLVHGDSCKHQTDTGMTETQAKCIKIKIEM